MGSVSGPYALDLPAWLASAAALDVDQVLLLEVLAEVESYILFAWSKPE